MRDELVWKLRIIRIGKSWRCDVINGSENGKPCFSSIIRRRNFVFNYLIYEARGTYKRDWIVLRKDINSMLIGFSNEFLARRAAVYALSIFNADEGWTEIMMPKVHNMTLGDVMFWFSSAMCRWMDAMRLGGEKLAFHEIELLAKALRVAYGESEIV
ncbi:MAG: hypothetical protein DRN03_04865 [Thermoplasmata archaeon]|nr:MAG: hypothetical protein DRN03_04865 [Thermoplasmata archaeon]